MQESELVPVFGKEYAPQLPLKARITFFHARIESADSNKQTIEGNLIYRPKIQSYYFKRSISSYASQ